MLDGVEIGELLGVVAPEGVAGVNDVTHDSRRAGPGTVFVAVPGFKRDGLRFAPDALRQGSPLVVTERSPGGHPPGEEFPDRYLVVPDARDALARLAVALYGDPSRRMEVYGVTGTNGKTTTSYALHSVLSAAFGEGSCGLMTTAETVIGAERWRSVRTTPEATEVQAALAEMLRSGVSRAVMEVSSHGVTLKRVTGTSFRGAIFTNLTRDHLDLHGSMEDYYLAKRELFLWTDGPKLSNADDEWGRRLATEVEGTLTFGVAPEADYRIRDVAYSARGTSFRLSHPRGEVSLDSPLLGPYNVLNVAGAASLALEVGVGEGDLTRAVEGMPQVPGRFERVGDGRGGFEVVVDYAHTDVGLEAVLKVARGMVAGGSGRVLCLFGAAGERDAAKRPLMGRIAAELADDCVITTDDAYGEDPADIAREVASGVPEGSGVETILDRRRAIEYILRRAGVGDVVVVAGKGHERVQHLPEGDVPFHDATVVAETLKGIRGGVHIHGESR